jgi:hypothetical protein
MLSVIMLYVVMLSVITLNVVMLSEGAQVEPMSGCTIVRFVILKKLFISLSQDEKLQFQKVFKNISFDVIL